MSTVFVRRLSRWQAETEREQIGDLYAEAYPDTRPPERDAFVRRFVDEELRQRDFDMVVAADPGLAGCAYGFRADRGDPWWDAFPGLPPGFGELTGGRPVFVLARLMVAPRRRRQGVATRLQRELLARSPAALALALLRPEDAEARAAHRSWGWSAAGRLVPGEGAAPLEAWARRPDG